MVIQKMSELVVTTDSPIEDRDEDSSEDQQGPLSSISENPASPMTSLGNEEPDIKDLDEQDEDSRNANYVNVEFQQTNTLDIDNNVPVSFSMPFSQISDELGTFRKIIIWRFNIQNANFCFALYKYCYNRRKDVSVITVLSNQISLLH